MSDPESFAGRWSRLKRATAKDQREAVSVQRAAELAETVPIADMSAVPADTVRSANKPPEAPFDPKSLPPIDSITAGSDIKAFLQGGRTEGFNPGRAQACLVSRSGDPRLHRTGGKPMGLHRSGGHARLRAARSNRQCSSLVAQAMGRLVELTEVPYPEEVALASEGAQMREGTPREIPAAPQTDNILQEREERLHQKHVAGEHRHGAEGGEPQQIAPAGKTGDINIRRTHGGAMPK